MSLSQNRFDPIICPTVPHRAVSSVLVYVQWNIVLLIGRNLCYNCDIEKRCFYAEITVGKRLDIEP